MIRLPYYEDSYFCLHNFSAHEMVFKGETYPTAEHAYHAQKFEDQSLRDEIKKARSPVEAWELGKKYKSERRQDWNDIKVSVLYEIIKEKVRQFPEVRDRLLSTGEEEIVEDSPNKFWGNGQDGTGENQCGKIYMRIREEIKNNQIQ